MSLPDTMKAVLLREYGGPEVLQIEEVPVPEPGPGEVLMRVDALAINNWDVRFRQGRAPQVPGRPAPKLPYQLGREAAGEVVAAGSGVSLAPGLPVVMMPNPSCGKCHYCAKRGTHLCVMRELPGHTATGSYAEYIVVAADSVLPAPEGMTAAELAPIIWAYGTAIHMINITEIQFGDTVVVTGAAGSLGIACIQLASLAGAGTIVALTRAPERKGATLRECGADEVLDPTNPETVARIRATSNGIGADVVLDNVGSEDMVALAIDIADLGGRVGLVAAQEDQWTDTIGFSIMKAFSKHITVFGSRASTRWEQQEVIRLAGSRQIGMPVAEVLPFSQIRRAHELQEAGHPKAGKIITPDRRR